MDYTDWIIHEQTTVMKSGETRTMGYVFLGMHVRKVPKK
jgi:hypothetical protein